MNKNLVLKTGNSRDQTLAVRLSKSDVELLERLRLKMSPFAPLSKGKVITAALKIADEYMKNVVR